MIYDPESNERTISVESSRRLGDSWTLSVEGRVFAGGKSVATDTASVLQSLVNADANNKLGYLQKDDYLQVELVYYF